MAHWGLDANFSLEKNTDVGEVVFEGFALFFLQRIDLFAVVNQNEIDSVRQVGPCEKHRFVRICIFQVLYKVKLLKHWLNLFCYEPGINLR